METYSREWQKTDSLLKAGLPQSAGAVIDNIYAAARQAKNMPQFIKAAIYRWRVKGRYEEEALAENIAETEALLPAAGFPAKNILHSIAAGLYWDYYRANPRQFHSRTALADGAGTPGDVRTFDLRQLTARCAAHYSASLAQPEALQDIPVGAYAAILDRADSSERYRPALFDFLAFRAADFYQSADAGLTQPADRFVMDKAEYFAPAAAFAQCPLATADSLSFPYRALAVWQQIIAFHLRDTSPEALADADLRRLDFVHRESVRPDRDSLYLSALQTLAAQYAGAPCAAEAAFRIAKHCNGQGDAYHPFTNPAPQWKKKEAVAVIDDAVKRFPGSLGAANCLALKNDILRPSLSFSVDEATPPGRPLLVNIAYRNVPKVYIKMIPLDFKKELMQDDSTRRAAYATAKAVYTSAVDLPADGDYQRHVTELALPAPGEGYYALLASTGDDFSQAAALLAETDFWITNISYVKKEGREQTVVQLLHRLTGEPLGGVTAQGYAREYDYNRRQYAVQYGETCTSGADGRITPANAAGQSYRSSSLYFTKGKDSYAGDVYFYRRAGAETPQYATTFFTDRAIYRPGQTVYFKGVVLKWEREKAATAAGYRQTVAFYNTNGEKVSELDVLSNEFGSFAGSFAVPAGGLTGQMYIRAMKAEGAVYFNVEEYKRPKFEVTLGENEAAYRLGERVTVSGKAKAYAGSAVSAAKVTYRVIREARYPLWRWWWGERPFTPAQEITNGETVTDADGSFGISFTAIPEADVNRALPPVCYYTVYASVSDINGETHEAKTSVPAGYRTLLLSSGLPAKILLDTLKEITVTATNLQGKALPAKGALAVWRLRSHARLLQPRRGERPDRLLLSREEFKKHFPYAVYGDEDNFERWERTQVFSTAFDTGSAAAYALPDVREWAEGTYMVTLSAKDPYGETVEDTAVFTGFRANGKCPEEAILFETLNPAAQPGETLKIAAGSAYGDVQAWMEITGNNGAELERLRLRLSGNCQTINIPVTEAHRGGFGVSLYFVKQNRAYSQNIAVQTPFDNKKLRLELSTFRDKLQPGQEEEWRITIKDNAGDAVAAELLASMYDASLDAFAPNRWNFFPWKNNTIAFRWNTNAAFRYEQSAIAAENFRKIDERQRYYDRLIPLGNGDPMELAAVAYSTARATLTVGATRNRMLADGKAATKTATEAAAAPDAQNGQPEEAPAPVLPLRTHFNETAFFYPQLTTNEQGETAIRFTVPGALTRWNLQALAWTRDLKTGYTHKAPVTQKELMIFPNAPRFFRENDTLYFSAKLSSLSAQPLDVTARLRLFDALTMRELSLLADGDTDTKPVALAAGGNSAAAWKIHIPEGVQAIAYRITATAATQKGQQASDGEENTLPVLANRTLVTETLPLPVRGAQPKTFTFAKLLHAGSPTLRHHAYTVEFTSHPVWYAIQALPYLMEYPYECAEQLFDRYYANTLAAYIANSYPEIRRIFDIWRNYQPEALQSNLEKNEELKSLLLEETPWVRDARNEAEQKRRIALLFDINRMRNEQAAAWRKMQQTQTPNGGFAWFNGGRDDRYITQYIVAGIGRLQQRNIPTGETSALLGKAIRYIDDRLAEDFHEMKKQNNKTPLPPLPAIHSLYARSFFIKEYPLPETVREAFAYIQTQAAGQWTAYNNYLKGMLTLALHRTGDTLTAQRILHSLSETALHSDEAGMYWRNEHGWRWHQAPVETQALLIEAFSEIARDTAAVADMQRWLLKQKQTQGWATTKATAEAVNALINATPPPPLSAAEPARKSRLADNGRYKIFVGDSLLAPLPDNGGAGYFKTAWHGAEIKPAMAHIRIDPPAAGQGAAAWGAAYWQYFEQMDKITPAAAGLQINRRLYRKNHSPNGDILTEITPEQPLKTGDKVTVRIEIRAGRDMEYLHLKDLRAAAFEPVNTLSGYRWQDGLGYYESMRDAAANFFLPRLPKGAYVFEYELFATQAGEFSTGITTLQCMYAPEFSAHSEGGRITVLPD
jgi:uncharacterized protein YfaS (alpha-2-macroglobulin family)